MSLKILLKSTLRVLYVELNIRFLLYQGVPLRCLRSDAGLADVLPSAADIASRSFALSVRHESLEKRSIFPAVSVSPLAAPSGSPALSVSRDDVSSGVGLLRLR
jgi:hypothetical protein